MRLAEPLVPIAESVLREDKAVECLRPAIEHFELLKFLAQELVERRQCLGPGLVHEAHLQVGLDHLEWIVDRLGVLVGDLGYDVRDDGRLRAVQDGCNLADPSQEEPCWRFLGILKELGLDSLAVLADDVEHSRNDVGRADVSEVESLQATLHRDPRQAQVILADCFQAVGDQVLCSGDSRSQTTACGVVFGLLFPQELIREPCQSEEHLALLGDPVGQRLVVEEVLLVLALPVAVALAQVRPEVVQTAERAAHVIVEARLMLLHLWEAARYLGLRERDRQHLLLQVELQHMGFVHRLDLLQGRHVVSFRIEMHTAALLLYVCSQVEVVLVDLARQHAVDFVEAADLGLKAHVAELRLALLCLQLDDGDDDSHVVLVAVGALALRHLEVAI